MAGKKKPRRSKRIKQNEPETDNDASATSDDMAELNVTEVERKRKRKVSAVKSPKKGGKTPKSSLKGSKKAVPPTCRASDRRDGGRAATVTFEEDGNMVRLTAEGIDSEYASETADSESEAEDVNNNATIRRRDGAQPGTSRDDLDLDQGHDSDAYLEEEDGEAGGCPPLGDNSQTSDSEEEGEIIIQQGRKGGKTKPRAARAERDEEIQSLRDEIQSVNQSFAKLQEMMEKGQYLRDSADSGGSRRHDEQPRRERDRDGRSADDRGNDRGNVRVELSQRYNQVNQGSDSITTVYRDAIQPKRVSNSSDDVINTSDETVDEPMETDDQGYVTVLERLKHANLQPLIPAHDRCRRDPGRDRDQGRSQNRDRRNDDVQPSTSQQGQEFESHPPEFEAERRADEVIRQAEQSKAKIYDVPGRLQGMMGVSEEQFAHSVFVDADCMMVGSHLEEITRRKIEACQFVDFGKLLPRDRVEAAEDHRMILVNHEGEQYYEPYSDRRNLNSINNYQKWEMAFRVFSDVFTRKYPNKASELIQYNHVIHTIAQTYPWDRVYRYDKAFREHMSRHPFRSWSIILQHAWNMKLNAREGAGGEGNLSSGTQGTPQNKSGEKSNKGGHKDVCWRYNRGKCSFGLSCRFEHRCGICMKSGHGAHNCRKMGFDKQDRQNKDRRDDRGDRNNQRGEGKARS